MGIMDSLAMLAGQMPQQQIAQQTATMQGQAQGRSIAQQLAERAAQDQRQIAKDAQDRAYQQAQMQHLAAQTNAIQNPVAKPREVPYEYTPDGMKAKKEMMAYGASLRPKPTGGTGSGQPPKLTEGERRGGALLTMAEQAAQTVLHAKAPNRLEALAGKVGFNESLSAERQKVNQAASQLVSSYLYLVSGATATDDEIARRTQELVPQPGDSTALIAQKQRAVATMLKAMRIAAGRGAGDSLGERPQMPAAQPDPSSLLDGY